MTSLGEPRADSETAATDSTTPVRITIEAEIDYEHAETFYRLYLAAFGPLRTRAAARQVLHKSEFFAEMIDARVWKYVAWADEDTPIAMTTITKSLDTVPWISPEYFQARFPEYAKRDAIYYLGFSLVHPENRYPRVLEQTFRLAMKRLVADRAICAYDLCAFNTELGFADRIERLLQRLGDLEVVPIDSQTYYYVRFDHQAVSPTPNRPLQVDLTRAAMGQDPG